MLAYNLYDKIEWYFIHYGDLCESPKVMRTVIDGKVVVAPKVWVKVIERTYELHKNLITPAMKMRYEGNLPIQTIADNLGVQRRQYYRWREEFLTDALFLALKDHIISLER